MSEPGEKNQDGGSVVDPGEFEAVKSKNAELVEKLNKLSKRLQEFGDLTPEQALEAAKKAKELEEAELAKKGEFETLKTRLQEENRKKVETLESEKAELQARLDKLLVQDGLSRAMDEVDVMPSRREFVRRYFLAEGPVVKGDRAVIQTAEGDVELAEYVRKWAESKDADAFVSGRAANGSGSKGSDGSSGGAKGWAEMSETEKAKLWKSDRAKARQMATAAGARVPA